MFPPQSISIWLERWLGSQSILTGRAGVGGRRRPRIRRHDLALLAALAALTPVAWLLPERLWDGFARTVVRFPLPGRKRNQHGEGVKVAIAELGQDSLSRIERESRANWILRQLQILRCYSRGGWRPQIHIEGRERIDAALAAGRGVILWSNAFRFADLVEKIALYEAGYALTLLSMSEHGGSISSFGIRWINPVLVRIEQRYLSARVVIDPYDPKRATEEVKRALRTNGIVCIFAIRGASRKPGAIQLLGARFEMGLGAPLFAFETGAALLPVFTLREADGSFRVIVEKEIAVPRHGSRIEVAMAAASELGRRLEAHIRVAPAQWTWWYMEPVAANTDGKEKRSA